MKLHMIILAIVGILLLAACETVNFTPANFSDMNLSNTTDVDDNDGMNDIISDVDKMNNDTENITDRTDQQFDDSIETRRIREGERIVLRDDIAYDPDGDTVRLSFSEPFNSQGVWQTEQGDAGQHLVNISATDGKTTSILQIRIIVEDVNAAPVIENFDDVTVEEGETVVLDPTITDPDGDEIDFEYSGWMTSQQKETGFEDAGQYQVTLTATDGEETTSETITITVENTNRAPELEPISDITATAGETVTIKPQANDPDGDTVTFSFGEPFNEAGSWQTEADDAGRYSVTVTATDGSLSTQETVVVTIDEMNRPPQLEVDPLVRVTEGQNITLTPEVSDPDNDRIQITYSGWMTSATRFVDYDQAGEHEVIITATDGQESVSATTLVVVEDKNRPPVFVPDIFEE